MECEACGDTLVKKDREPQYKFVRRRFCNKKCADSIGRNNKPPPGFTRCTCGMLTVEKPCWMCKADNQIRSVRIPDEAMEWLLKAIFNPEEHPERVMARE